MTSIAARCRALLACLATLAAVLVIPAAAGAAAASPAGGGCPDRAVAQPFAAWHDMANYFLAPDGGFEGSDSTWTSTGGAGVVGGNEPFHVGAPGDARSLLLPGGASATTAPFCIGTAERSMRFLADAARSGTLDVDVLYIDAGGSPRSLRIGTAGGTGHWSPTAVVPMIVNTLAADRGGAMSVRLRFAPRGPAAWTIDDVLVDPYRTR